MGEILEIGCGSGRVLLPIARAGGRITGLDQSRAMLDRLREKVAAEPAEVRSRIQVTHGDARAFDLGRRFSLVTAPFRVFQHMLTIDDQLALLSSVKRHLAPGGRFIFDVFNPKFSLMHTDRSAETEDTPLTPLPDGRGLRRAARIVRVNWLDQVNDVELIYYVTPAGGGEPARHVQAFGMRWFLKAEIEHLLARSGLKLMAVYGDFDRGPLADGAPEQIWCCEAL